MASLFVENLTDLEIRAKFLELGENIGPVTSTTRKLYIKRLKSILDANNSLVDLNSSVKSEPQSYSHSSGEESDSGAPRTRRRSMPPPRTNKSPSRRKSPNRVSLNNNAVANSTFLEHRKTEESYNSYPSSPTSNDSDSRRLTRSSLNTSNSARSPGIYGVESELDVSLPRPMLSQSNKENYKVTNISPTKLTSPDLGIGLSDTFKSRLQASGSASFTSSYSPSRHSSSNQPYASDFMRKLSANKSALGTSFSSSISSKLLDVKESDDEDTGSSQVYTRFTQGVRSSPIIKGRRKQNASYQDSWLPFDSTISTVLLLIFSSFFVVLGVTYVNMHSADTTVSSPTDIYYPLCSTMTETNPIPRVNCIKDVDKEITTQLFKDIYSAIHEKAKNAPCSEVGNGPFQMSDVEIRAIVFKKDNQGGTWISEQQLPNVKVLITSNPQLNLMEITGGIVLLNPPLSFYCSIWNNLLVVATYFAKGFIVVAAFGLVYFLVKLWLKKEASHKDEVYKLVSNVIDIVAARSQGPEGFVPMSHVRDQLISPKDRQRMEKLWNDAVDVLNSDSRVRCEQQVVEGEDCLVWRWVASPYNSNKRKTWQGQAFDTMEGSVNSLPSSPTSCLKIRHMFDAAVEEGEDWIATVVDAILEKTGDARILHIAVERQSREGCVYMKCASPTDAGKAYRALHGSWFDSKLVTVKYIREARYLERFPESAKCSQPLYSSSKSHNSFK